MELLPINGEELRLLDRMGGEGRWVLSVFLRLDLPEVPTRHSRSRSSATSSSVFGPRRTGVLICVALCCHRQAS